MSTRTSRPRPVKAVSGKKRPEVVKPAPFDKAQYKINALKQLTANQAELIADLQAQNAELMEFLKANAELLEITILDGPEQPSAQESPVPADETNGEQ